MVMPVDEAGAVLGAQRQRKTKPAALWYGGVWGGVSGDSFDGENFVRGKCQHTSNFGAGPSDAGNFNTPNFRKMRPLFHSNRAHKHSRRRPTSHSQARARGTDVTNRRSADNSATIPRYRHQRACTRTRNNATLRPCGLGGVRGTPTDMLQNDRPVVATILRHTSVRYFVISFSIRPLCREKIEVESETFSAPWCVTHSALILKLLSNMVCPRPDVLAFNCIIFLAFG